MSPASRLLEAARNRTLHRLNLTGLPVDLRPFLSEGFASIFDRGIAHQPYPLLSGFPVRPRFLCRLALSPRKQVRPVPTG